LRHTFASILKEIRTESKNKRELGTKFEKLTKDFLKVDRLYKNRFKKVWMWSEWPGNDGQDTGIDLVAEQRDGSLCAIQCKCYEDDGSLDMKAISNFIAKSKTMKFTDSILAYTGRDFTSHARKLLESAGCKTLQAEHFENSSVDWTRYPNLTSNDPKKLRPHQSKAVKDVIAGLKDHDRGKLIMACGTGKTLASLHIAERQVGVGGIVLYLVPSISLILQSMREWSDNANIKHSYAAVCSDKSTGEDASITELESPASTNVQSLKPHILNRPKNAMTVIFSTYHSIEVAGEAAGHTKFDLIICDEAHRTTGVEDASFFTKVHNNSLVRGKKRLYMTATPRVYSEAILANTDRVICDMNDVSKYGPEFHRLGFTDAVNQDILSDFKVKIAIVPEDKVDADFQWAVTDDDNVLNLDERTLLAAVWHGLQYPEDDETPKLLQKVIAFTNRIDRSEMFAGTKTDPDGKDRSFKGIVSAYEKKRPTGNTVEVRHIDGKTNALNRRSEMRWLDASDSDPKTCRILSNARCLSEGVDVPKLDGVIFLSPRKSKVDVVQSVGRVMRKVPGKKYGYVILPVAIPPGIEYHHALDDNKRFRIVWQVLNALRSHDENFANEINTLILDKNNTSGKNPTPRISVSILDTGTIDTNALDDSIVETEITKFFDKIKSKLVEKVGDTNYYDKYGQEIGRSANAIEEKIRHRIQSDHNTKTVVQKFHKGLQELVNKSVTEDQTIQVIAQHMVMSRVFDALFHGEFTSYNPISLAFDGMIEKMRMNEELKDLEDFYKDAEQELARIQTREARQNFIKKIYGNFFESADKKGAEKHGIVYTPVEVIDFIIQSVQHLLKEHFGIGFDSRTVKVLEPFAGTGTFVTRLLESGLSGDKLYDKYRNDLMANEITLLAYYVATVNIETTYSSLQSGKYVPFEGVNYVDTLNLNPRYLHDARHRQEKAKLDVVFEPAHKRIRQQRKTNVDVIIGNPPYSKGQSSYNNQNQNIPYPEIDERIRDTYLRNLKKAKKKPGAINSLFDSYIRSIRWVSDRIGDSGIIGLVTNGSFIRTDTTAGVRASLAEEFNEIWCFDLRGNAMTQGEIRKKEAGNVFGSGSRASVAITILVKNPKKKSCVIRYKDIGDYHSREEKLKIIKKSNSIAGIKDWQIIKPDRYYDWLDHRTDNFNKYLLMGDSDTKKGIGESIFRLYSQGILTARDAWAYNSSITILAKNMKQHINYCNIQNMDNFIIDPKKAKWDEELADKIKRHKPTL